MMDFTSIRKQNLGSKQGNVVIGAGLDEEARGRGHHDTILQRYACFQRSFLFIIPPKPQTGPFFVLTVLDTNEFPCVDCCLGIGLEEIVDRTRYLELSPFLEKDL